MRLVIFDIDGTLLLTGGAGLECLRRIYRSMFGLDEAIVDGVAVHGRTDPLIVQDIARRSLGRDLDAAELREFTRLYEIELERVLADGFEGFRVLPGAETLVRDLAEDSGVHIGLATGNFERAAWAKLRRAGLHEFFEWGGFASDSEDRDELTRIAVERGRERAGLEAPAVIVGDTVHDVRSAAAAGVPCLAVATGNATADVLRAEGARWTVDRLDDPRVREILLLELQG